VNELLGMLFKWNIGDCYEKIHNGCHWVLFGLDKLWRIGDRRFDHHE
jgi:hypothetical protein